MEAESQERESKCLKQVVWIKAEVAVIEAGAEEAAKLKVVGEATRREAEKEIEVKEATNNDAEKGVEATKRKATTSNIAEGKIVEQIPRLEKDSQLGSKLLPPNFFMLKHCKLKKDSQPGSKLLPPNFFHTHPLWAGEGLPA